ncbi:hypothetical protein PQE75_gp207 [Bacillus phage vB_BcoS-136]|uniref:Uncharacterized protein n=1 Tax=Bacillus phage vB_BcoS-136 TaxID=2419619 RepID=A0A3G3BVI2_9CAUD|nr:hypothetical protein PQE75_gp207 [Bacillus phage vB_BcoS-136]AYP68272.1 hypothetical protein vBBcoS136_00158 [Bacillus phage vB_BcoS-136]
MSYITLTLDTTSPTLEIYSPSYTTRENDVEFRILANEKIDSWQEIYIIDKDENRHDYTFKVEDKEIIGIVNFNNYPLGLATIYVKTRDEVHNVSSLFKKTITIKNSLSILTLSIDDFKKIDMKDNNINRFNDISDKSRIINIKDGNGRVGGI